MGVLEGVGGSLGMGVRGLLYFRGFWVWGFADLLGRVCFGGEGSRLGLEGWGLWEFQGFAGAAGPPQTSPPNSPPNQPPNPPTFVECARAVLQHRPPLNVRPHRGVGLPGVGWGGGVGVVGVFGVRVGCGHRQPRKGRGVALKPLPPFHPEAPLPRHLAPSRARPPSCPVPPLPLPPPHPRPPKLPPPFLELPVG